MKKITLVLVLTLVFASANNDKMDTEGVTPKCVEKMNIAKNLKTVKSFKDVKECLANENKGKK